MGAKRKKIILFWSGGKDSAISLFELKSPEWKILGLLTTTIQSEESSLVQMHNLPIELIRHQAASLDLPLEEVVFDTAPNNLTYEKVLGEKIEQLKKEKNIEALAFGDIHLEDVKDYKVKICQRHGVEAVFPLWGWSSDLVLQAFSGLGHKAVVHCIQKDKLPPAFLGRLFNASFVEDLPPSVDPSGEKGEFHSFVFDGPFFQEKLNIKAGPHHEKSGFLYQELSLNLEGSNRDN